MCSDHIALVLNYIKLNVTLSHMTDSLPCSVNGLELFYLHLFVVS